MSLCPTAGYSLHTVRVQRDSRRLPEGFSACLLCHLQTAISFKHGSAVYERYPEVMGYLILIYINTESYSCGAFEESFSAFTGR